MKATSLVLVACALASLSSAARAGVIKVPGDYATLQVAVNNAADGDVIVVQAGFQSAGTVIIDDKAVSVIVESNSIATVPQVTVRNLSPGRDVLLRGLGANGNTFPLGPNAEALVLENNQGHVSIEGATFVGAEGIAFIFHPDFHPDGYEAATITGSASVAFVHCTFIGGLGANYHDEDTQFAAGRGGWGIAMDGGDLSVTGCSVTGGDAGDQSETGNDGPNGGSAIGLFAGRLYVSGCTLVGGDACGAGCWIDPFSGSEECGVGGDGGSGIDCQGEAKVWQHGNVFVPGEGGLSGDGEPLGQDGRPLDLGRSATTTPLPSPARDFTTSSVRREGQTGTLTFNGEPNDFAFIWVALAPGWKMLPAFEGAFLLSGSSNLIGLASTGPSGTLAQNYTVPPLPAVLDGLVIRAQSVFKDTSGHIVLGPASSFALLDAAF